MQRQNKIKLILTISGILLGAFLCSDSAYAAFSASISRSGTVSLAEPGSSTIRPTSTGTLGTGSDTVNVTTNCTYGGYKLYVSATSTGGTALKLSDNSDSIPTSSTAVGSETTLSRDTWGVGKTASAFSGLQAYTDDIGMLTPFYTGTSSDSYSFYYGVNVSTAKTPGTYTGEVLYTVLMDEACTKYTLNFDGNSATINNLTPQSITFDDTINLADISSASKIARTGYTLTGWKDQNGNSYGTSGTADINPSDLATVTLTAQWQINSNNVTVNKGTNVTTVTGAGSYDYNSAVTIAATAFSTGYHFSGWTVNSGGATLYSNSAMTTQSTTSTPAYFRMPDNAVTVTANATANTYTIKFNGQGGTVGTSSTTGTYGGSITSSTASYSGYSLVGWSHTAYTAGQGSATYATTDTTSLAVSTLASAAGVANTNSATINLYAVWQENVKDCSDTVHPTQSAGCKMKDNRTWILGSTLRADFNSLCANQTNVNGHNATCSGCPSGYNFPIIEDYDALIRAYGGTSYRNHRYGYKEDTGALAKVLGLLSDRSYWSSTEDSSNTAYYLYAWSDHYSISSGYNMKTYQYYTLCYK